MAPNRRPSTRASAKKNTSTQQAPPSEEDAKPNVDELNAGLEAEAEAQEQLPPDADADADALDLQPDHGLVPEAEPDPSAALTIPDEPAATAPPPPPPTRRLDSLNARGRKSIVAPRFTGRRSQAERTELDKAKAAGEATTAKESPAAESARGGSGRGRGRGRGDSARGHERRGPVASGPFSAGQVSKEIQQKNKRWSHRGSGWSGWRMGSEGREGIQPTTRAGRAKAKDAAGQAIKLKPDANGDVSMEDGLGGGYISSEDEEINGQRRMDVEKLGIIDLTQGDSDVNPFAPVRLARVAHKERGLGFKADRAVKTEPVDETDEEPVSTSPSKPKGSKGKARSKDAQVVAEKQSFQGVYSDTDSDTKGGVQVKPEPEEYPPDELSSSPESKRKGKEKYKVKATVMINDSTPEEYDEETEMDREEDERRQKDLDTVCAELGKPAHNAEKDGDATMTDSEVHERRTDKVYLFQFPPLLPDLEPIVVKPDPDASDSNGDVMQLDPPNNSSKPIKIEDDGKLHSQQPRLPSGAVGKMKVHASGRVTLDWGGMSLCLGMGGKADFLQYVVAASLPDQKEGENPSAVNEQEEGQAINVGRIKEKFVVTPDWGELLE